MRDDSEHFAIRHVLVIDLSLVSPGVLSTGSTVRAVDNQPSAERHHGLTYTSGRTPFVFCAASRELQHTVLR